ncbi:Inner membrane protein ytfF [Serratia plymuthica]|nr:Inner membrane protein ytfF [Serratia plymuthica]
MFVGVLFALSAGLMWGLIFVGPVLIPEYPARYNPPVATWPLA